jgi:hypothetical protein
MSTQFWLESLKGRDHLEDLGVDGEENIEGNLKAVGFLDWIYLAQVMYQWQALVNTVMNIS